ncbi:MAG: NAD-dependent epimerase/dehydratase family protein [candidate division Zixibacteria bacterium]|nr:NAD-dependent epimerase/dehydratase family protein [candidate division Zixibacteria bacterium]
MSRNKIHPELPQINAKCLVTGANGFVGSHLCERLLELGCDVYAFIRRTSDTKYLKDLDVHYRYGELNDTDSLMQAVEGFEYIFHVGGVTKAKLKSTFYDVNQQGTANLLHAVRKNCKHIKKFIYISSQAAVGPSQGAQPAVEEKIPAPVTTYGKSKLEGEKEVLKYSDSLPYVIIRPPGVYGPRDTEILTFFKAASLGIKPFFSGEEATISLIYVENLVDGIIRSAISEKTIGNTYLISDGNVLKWNEVVDTLLSAFGKKGLKVTIPVSIFMLWGWISELAFKAVGKTPMLTREKALEITAKNWGCSIDKAINDFNYTPRFSFEEGINITAQWYNENKWL